MVIAQSMQFKASRQPESLDYVDVEACTSTKGVREGVIELSWTEWKRGVGGRLSLRRWGIGCPLEGELFDRHCRVELVKYLGTRRMSLIRAPSRR